MGRSGEALDVLRDTIAKQLDLRDSQNHTHLTKLQHQVPLIANFLVGLSKPNPHVFTVIQELLAVVETTFEGSSNIDKSATESASVDPSSLSFFHASQRFVL